MTRYSKWLGVLVALVAVLSTLAYSVEAAGVRASSHTGTKSAAKKSTLPARCKKINKASGTIKYSDWQFPDSLNPYESTEAVSAETWNGIFDGLFTYNSQAHLTPQMAATIPSLKNGGIKNGGKTIVVHLKKGLRWSNGTEITSKDVKFGWKVGMDKATGPACSGSCDIITRIDTPDKYTAVLNLKQVYAPVLAYGMPPIWPSKWGSEWNGDAHAAALKLGQDPNYNFESTSYPTDGAYQVSSFVKDDRITLKPMKYYSTMNCGGYVKNLIFAFYANKPSMIAAAANKETDVTQNYTVADLGDLGKHAGSFKISATPGFAMEHLEYNLDSKYNGAANPLANTNVRVALSLALNKLGLIQSALGVSPQQAKGVVAWTPWINTPSLKQAFADKSITGQWDPIAKKYVNPGTASAIKDAKKILAKTPYKSGFSVDFYTTSGNPVRQAQESVIAQSWQQIGVNVKPNFVPASTLFASDWAKNGILDHGTFQVAMFGFSGSPDPDQLKYNLVSRYVDRNQSTHAAINGNDAGIQDKLIDKSFTAGAHSLDPKARGKAYTAVQVEMAKKSYWDMLYFKPVIATADNRVSNFANNPTQLGPTWNMYNWKAKTS